MDTFTYTPSVGFAKKITPNVHVANFGDGYSQRVSNGIHPLKEEWELTFEHRSLSDSDSIITFFNSKAGADPFYWTPTGESTQIVCVCPEWELSYSSPISRTITCKFERVYGYA